MTRAAGEAARDREAVLEDLRLVRLSARTFLRRLLDPLVEGRVYWPEETGPALDADVWIVNDAAVAFLFADPAVFVAPSGGRFAASRFDARDWRRIAEAWRIAGGVSTAENVLAAALHFERHGAPAEPGDDRFIEIRRSIA